MKEEKGIEKKEAEVIKEEKKETKKKKEKYTKSINFPGLVDVASDPDGKVVYLIKENGKISISREEITDEEVLIPPGKKNMPFELADAGKVLYHFYSKTFEEDFYSQVEDYFRKACYLEDDQFLLVSLYVFLTYLRDHKDVRHMPIYLFFAVPERGKTRIGRSITNIAYRGVHTVNLNPAGTFRYMNDHRASIFFDVMDLWTDVVKHNVRDIFLTGFHKGATISRVLYPERGPFNDTVIYEIYGPMIIATNEAVNHILGTRCIEISTPNMPGEYTNYLANDRVVLELKALLTAWKAKLIDEQLPLVKKVSGIDGRLWDISKPLLSVCKWVCPGRYDELVNALLKQAKSRVEDKGESLEGRIVNIIHKLSKSRAGNVIMTSEIEIKLNDGLPEAMHTSAKTLGRRLKALGIKTDRLTGRSRVTIEQGVLEKLYEQYDCNQIEEPATGETQVTQKTIIS